jgi:hypothetical protein
MERAQRPIVRCAEHHTSSVEIRRTAAGSVLVRMVEEWSYHTICRRVRVLRLGNREHGLMKLCATQGDPLMGRSHQESHL